MTARPTRRQRRWSRRARQAGDRFRSAAEGIPIELGEAQGLVHAHGAKTRVLVAGRRFGKTVLAILELVLFALLNGNTLSWYVAPTKEMAEEIAWDALKELLRKLPASLVSSISETKMRVRFRNGSVIQLKSAHKRDSLRGRGVSFLVLDECAMLDKLLWDEVLQAALADKDGRALLISTPKGFNWFYDLYNEGLGQRFNPDAALAAWQFTTMDGGRVSDERLAVLRSRMTPRAFRQELLASFEALGGRVYDLFVRDKHVATQALVDRGGPLYVGFDFNVNPMTAVVGQRGALADELEVLAALSIETSNTREAGQEVIRQFGAPDHEGRPTRILIAHPDPAGKNRDTRSGTTDHAILEALGFAIDASPAHPPVFDRVSLVNTMLEDAAGRVRLRLDPTRCAPLVRTMEGQVWKAGKYREPEKKDGLDHPGDALGYLVWQSFNLHDASLWGDVRVSW